MPMFERCVLLALRFARFAEPAMKRTPFVTGFFFALFVAVRCVIGGLCLSFCFPERASRLTQVFCQGQLRAGRA